MTYLAFALKERRSLSFAVSLTFFSSFGQTFLISLFVPFFLAAYSLTSASFGTIYSLATLGSAVVLPWLGQWIDRIPLRRYSLFVAGGLFAASLLMAVSWHIGVLFVALMLLRLTGQGLSGHTAQTAMARNYDHQRGKALSISNLGFPLGEAVIPVAIAGLLAFFHWRTTWLMVAALIALILIPAIWFLTGRKSSITNNDQQTVNKYSAGESYSAIFSDPRIFYIIPATLLPPFWITGLFLYQVASAEQLGWTAAIIASSFIAFAAARIGFGLISGPLVDCFSARILFPFYMLPMLAGLAFALFFNAGWAAFVYMALLGASMGLAGTIKSALWAEMYGTEMIGTVRSLFSSFMVFSTALSPFLLGWMLDFGITMSAILVIAIITTITGGLLSIRLFFSE